MNSRSVRAARGPHPSSALWGAALLLVALQSSAWAGRVPLFRVWNPGNGDHLYTASSSERDAALVHHGYVDEGIACEVLSSATHGAVPLYRLWNPGNGDHLYTASSSERDAALVHHGYVDEGVAGYVLNAATSGAVPLYRLFHPGSGDHFYTTSGSVRDGAISSAGYVDEGVAAWVWAHDPPPSTFSYQVGYGQTQYTVSFSRYSCRSPNFEVQIQQSDGTLYSASPPESGTYLGTIQGLPGAVASAIRLADGTVHYRVLFEDGTEWVNEGSLTTVRSSGLGPASWPAQVPAAHGAGNVIYGADVGVDVPYHTWAEVYGSDVDTVLDTIEHRIVNTNMIYLRDVGIEHTLRRVVIRSSESNDPYDRDYTPRSNFIPHTGHIDYSRVLDDNWDSSYELLVLFRREADVWQNASGATVATIGRCYTRVPAARLWVAEVGDPSSILRHEIGHAWGLPHCPGENPEGPTIMCAGAKLSGPEQATVVGHRNSNLVQLEPRNTFAVSLPPKAATDRAEVDGPHTIDVLANDHDGNGHSIWLVGVDPSSSLGGTVSLANGAVRYQPPMPPASGVDRFGYRIRDIAGREAIGWVFVRRPQ